MYPASGAVDETTPVGDEIAEITASTLEAEREVARFADGGGRGVVLRLGLLYGPGTGSEEPAERFRSYGATLRIEDACSALAAALDVPGGIYNVLSDGERVSNERFEEVAGWRPEHQSAPSRA